MISTFAGALVDLILNAILIPWYGSIGAAIGTLVAEFVVLIVQLIYIKDNVKYLYANQGYLKLILALLIASLAAICIKCALHGIFIKLVVSAIAFFGLYVVVLYILKEEVVVENVRSAIGKIIKK